jgi:uncharacterized protein YjbJ (UPF0337 family)
LGEFEICWGLVSNDGMAGSAWQKAEGEVKEVVGTIMSTAVDTWQGYWG